MATTTAPGHTALVTITVNNREVQVPRDTTGGAIKAAAGVPADFELFKIQGSRQIKVEDAEEVRVRPGQRFVASPTLDPS